ncbi:sulfotransferase [Nannocystaceae bacterium ST9]
MSDDFTDWLPIRVSTCGEPSEWCVEWCHFGARRFREPFFEQTLAAALREPFALVFRRTTPIAALLDWHADKPGLAPRGFVFHMSRCGSTLVAQMLAAAPEHRVLSEPPPLDTILRSPRAPSPESVDDDRRVAWLRAWISAAGQPRAGERELFVKLDAWHVFDLPLIRRAFPDTPWIFLHRNPIEVLVSALRGPGLQFVPGFDMPGIDIQGMTIVEQRTRVLAAILAAALEHLPAGGLAIDYARLPDAMFDEIRAWFGLELSNATIDRMRAATAFHAKTPSAFFEADGHTKQREASAEAREWCARLLDPLHERLLGGPRGLEPQSRSESR